MGLLCDTCISISTCKFKKVFKNINIEMLKIDEDSPFNITCKCFNNIKKDSNQKTNVEYKRTNIGFIKV